MEDVKIIISGIEHKLVENHNCTPRCDKGNEPCQLCSLYNVCTYPEDGEYSLCIILGGNANSHFMRI